MGQASEADSIRTYDTPYLHTKRTICNAMHANSTAQRHNTILGMYACTIRCIDVYMYANVYDHIQIELVEYDVVLFYCSIGSGAGGGIQCPCMVHSKGRVGNYTAWRTVCNSCKGTSSLLA